MIAGRNAGRPADTVGAECCNKYTAFLLPGMQGPAAGAAGSPGGNLNRESRQHPRAEMRARKFSLQAQKQEFVGSFLKASSRAGSSEDVLEPRTGCHLALYGVTPVAAVHEWLYKGRGAPQWRMLDFGLDVPCFGQISVGDGVGGGEGLVPAFSAASVAIPRALALALVRQRWVYIMRDVERQGGLPRPVSVQHVVSHVRPAKVGASWGRGPFMGSAAEGYGGGGG